MRHLSAAPYTEPQYEEYLPLWEKALSQWASASAWYGLHGHLSLGRLAAVNSLLGIRQHMSTTMQSRVGLPSIQGTQGAIASEYYSIAKLVESFIDRHSLLKKALWNVNTALAVKQNSDISGLLAIRGSIRLGLGQPLKAVKDYREVLQQRLDANEGPGSVGEAQAELGMAYLCLGRVWKAQELLEAGVESLALSSRHPFTVRALKKLSYFYALTFRRERAAQALECARSIAMAHEIEGQLEQLERRG
jgi:tetratricopeptide (TPR) repeat protein